MALKHFTVQHALKCQLIRHKCMTSYADKAYTRMSAITTQHYVLCIKSASAHVYMCELIYSALMCSFLRLLEFHFIICPFHIFSPSSNSARHRLNIFNKCSNYTLHMCLYVCDSITQTYCRLYVVSQWRRDTSVLFFFSILLQRLKQTVSNAPDDCQALAPNWPRALS